jgi:polyhydroxyalkanoate synthase subunit PhaC
VHLPPRPTEVTSAVVNTVDKVRRRGIADTRVMPRQRLATGTASTLYRYDPDPDVPTRGAPVLLVPPLAAPASCFELRRGCSVVEHLVGTGRSTYLVDYGAVRFADRRLGIEHFVDEVVPDAVVAVAQDAAGGDPDVAGGEPSGARVHLEAWCLGGIFSLLAAAARPDLPIRSIAAIASPMDVTAVPLIAPFRPVVNAVGRRVITASYRFAGGAPAPLVRRAFWATSIGKHLTKPLAVARNLDDRDFLAQLEAVDAFTSGFQAYPGRTFGQLYHRFFRANDLASGHLDLGGRRIALADLQVPVLAVAGADDTIAPVRAVQHLTELLPNAASVRFEIAPGGHLGVLTGRAARTTTWPLVDAFLADHDDHAPA